ncbi:MAG: RsmE family RNA methyltransferase [Eubacteriales bacterium]|nr:RsmE family RNA methyltransferase [Eubacteriales bacterium]
MHHFFVSSENIDETAGLAVIDDSVDYNHAVNVLRLKAGEQILISDSDGCDYLCAVRQAAPDKRLELDIIEKAGENHELPARVILFQCVPKSDKMELIIQKAVELGVTDIVPVFSKYCVVKLDDKKAESRIKRWQAISESAAKQSKRSVIPKIHKPVDFKQAAEMCEQCDVRIIPYEAEDGLTGICEAIVNFLPGRSIGVIVGPEGGFAPMEVTMAKRHAIVPVSLGKRILRAETAAIAILSLIMIRLEIAAGIDLSTEE